MGGIRRSFDPLRGGLEESAIDADESDAKVAESMMGQVGQSRLIQKQATRLEPLRIPDLAVVEADSGADMRTDGLVPRAVTRMKRSLSNIFDLPSPVRSNACPD